MIKAGAEAAGRAGSCRPREGRESPLRLPGTFTCGHYTVLAALRSPPPPSGTPNTSDARAATVLFKYVCILRNPLHATELIPYSSRIKSA